MECTPGIAQVLADAGVAVAWVFGSRARGAGTGDSDGDLAVLAEEGRQPLDLLEISELAGRLEGLLEGPVDVVGFERDPLQLQARIVLEARLPHSADEPLRVRTVAETQSRWEDVRPAVEAMDRPYLEAVARRGPGGRGWSTLIASKGWEPATAFREAFDRLREHGVLEDALAGHPQSLAGLRNRLVHLYDDVDDRLVHRALVRRLADLDAFARAYAGRVAEE